MGTTKQAVARSLEHKGIRLMDAPVSGGVAGAEKGTLTIMGGADEALLNEYKEVLQGMGTRIFHTGGVGSASNVKMLNQMLNAANTAIAAEVLCLSRKLGVDDEVLSRVVNQSSGGSYIFERNVPKYMMTGDHTPGFRLDLMTKDVGLFTETAKEKDSFFPVHINEAIQLLISVQPAQTVGEGPGAVGQYLAALFHSFSQRLDMLLQVADPVPVSYTHLPFSS